MTYRNCGAGEIPASVTKEDLIATMVEGIVRGGLQVLVHSRAPDPIGSDDYDLKAFADARDVPCPNLYLQVAHDIDVPITHLIDATRESGVPLFTEYGEWLAWDVRELRLKHPTRPLDWLWKEACAAVPPDNLSERQLRIVSLLRDAVLSPDHGKKPVLLRREFLQDAIQCREFAFEGPRLILPSEFDDHVLAYYDASGSPRSLPLGDAAMLGLPIATRHGAYTIDRADGALTPCINEAKLLAAAFSIATTASPTQFGWFAARERGTIFQSGVDRIEAPHDPSGRPPRPAPSGFRARAARGDLPGEAPPRRYGDSFAGGARADAESIVEWSNHQLGTVYIAVSGHPLETPTVTTPALYLHAVQTLERFGYFLQYLNDSVGIRKAGEPRFTGRSAGRGVVIQ